MTKSDKGYKHMDFKISVKRIQAYKKIQMKKFKLCVQTNKNFKKISAKIEFF